MMMMMVIR